jgi:hypothetical protein
MIHIEDSKKIVLKYFPFIFSLVLFSLFLILNPFTIKKYNLEFHDGSKEKQSNFYTYSDLDNDGYSEKIRILCLEHKRITGIVVYKDNRIVEQWNFNGVVNLDKLSFMIGDYDRNSYKEIALFTYHNDSIYLNIIEPFPDKEIKVGNRAYSEISKGLIGVPGNRFGIKKGGFANLDSQPEKELYFSIASGGYINHPQPRRVCIYNIRKDTVIFSDKAGVLINNPEHFDLNNDHVPEIVGDLVSFGNHHKDYPYTDLKGWLMVFNNKLDFLFPPIPFDKYPIRLQVETFKKNNKGYLLVYKNYYGTDSISSKLLIYDKAGKLINDKILTDLKKPKESNIFIHEGKMYFITGNGKIHLLDKSLNIKKEWRLDKINNGHVCFKGDLDGDNKCELIFKGEKPHKFIITQHDLKHPVSVSIPYENNNFHFAIKEEGSDKQFLYAHTNQISATYSYKKNPLYVFRLPLYIGLFGLIWLFVWLMKFFQSKLINERYKSQKKINELQLKTVKSQLEPHMTFNLLNSLSGLLYNEEIEKANDIIVKYSKLLRHSLINSDKIFISLSDEMNHIENYLEIEKYRHDNKFDYKIDVSSDVNSTVTIPKMLIFTFVENAVKHGIRPLNCDGFIHLKISSNRKFYLVDIMDNGIGMKKAGKRNKASTKKGIDTVDKIINYFKEIKKKKINYEITYLDDNNENPGTHVKLYLPNR